MNEAATLVLAIFGAIMVWTTSVIGGVVWLNAKFRRVEVNFFREADKRRREVDAELRHHAVKIQRLEIYNFGITGPDFQMPENGKDHFE